MLEKYGKLRQEEKNFCGGGDIFMKYGTAIWLLSQTAVILALVYGYYREADVVRLEDRLFGAMRKRRARCRRIRERRRAKRLNARALYRPLKCPAARADDGTKAA